MANMLVYGYRYIKHRMIQEFAPSFHFFLFGNFRHHRLWLLACPLFSFSFNTFVPTHLLLMYIFLICEKKMICAAILIDVLCTPLHNNKINQDSAFVSSPFFFIFKFSIDLTVVCHHHQFLHLPLFITFIYHETS
jgi:hypothetical protein